MPGQRIKSSLPECVADYAVDSPLGYAEPVFWSRQLVSTPFPACRSLHDPATELTVQDTASQGDLPTPKSG